MSTDSRTLQAGALFVALRGPKFDGAQFVAAAAARGAVGALVDRAVPSAPLPQIVVADALHGLQRLAQAWRADFSIPIVAIGGSNGKTTVKEMTAAILARSGPCMATHGNLNNHIGVPLTLMRLEPSHRSAVIEMGANRIGDVAELVRLARPTVGLITNAGAEHLEGFGDLDGVAQGEGEMVGGLEQGAAAIINADDAYADYWRTMAARARASSPSACAPRRISAPGTRSRRSSAGSSRRGSPWCARWASARSCSRPAARTISSTPWVRRARPARREHPSTTSAPASRNSVPCRVGCSSRRACATAGSSTIPTTPIRARCAPALDVLRSLSGTTWLVLADMAELGEHTSDSHATMGRYARDCGVKRLFAFGPQSSRAVETFGSGGEWFADVDSLIRRLQAELSPGVTVLIKGSRVNRLERVVQALSGGGAGSGPMMRAS